MNGLIMIAANTMKKDQQAVFIVELFSHTPFERKSPSVWFGPSFLKALTEGNYNRPHMVEYAWIPAQNLRICREIVICQKAKDGIILQRGRIDI
jgi:hypothetical protein